MKLAVFAASLPALAAAGGLALFVSIVPATGATTGATAAAAACAYTNPDAERIAAVMEAMTPEVFTTTSQWAGAAALAGLDPQTPLSEANEAQRRQALTAAVRNILTTTAPHSISTPPIVWWHGAMPADNDDTTWQSTPVPGWPGTLADYITELTARYADTAPAAGPACQSPAAAGLCGQPAEVAAIAATIRHLESGDNYLEHKHSRAAGYTTSSGNPSGAYQFLHSTWAGHGGHGEAYQAPPAVQDERAAQDINAILARFTTVDWVPVAWYVGLSGAQKIRDGQWPMSYLPNPQHNTITVGDYQTKWMTYYTTTALPAAGAAAAECPTGNNALIAWADTQLGAPYAAIDPYRFGTPPWPGGRLTGFRGDPYNFPAGTTLYDCSGFVIAAYRTIGIDFPSQHGIYGSQGFNTNQLPDAPRTALQPGDIAVYRPSDSGVGHVVLIHHTDPDGAIRTIEATPARGVTIGALKWDRVTAIKRPTP
jgi:hypothetical protein